MEFSILFEYWSFEQTLELGEYVGLVLDGRDKYCSDARIVRRPDVGEDLITHKYSITLVRSHIRHGVKNVSLEGLFSLIICREPELLIEEIYSLTAVVRYYRGRYSLRLKRLKPRNNVLSRGGVFVRFKSVIYVKYNSLHSDA